MATNPSTAQPSLPTALGAEAETALSDEELEAHIEHCTHLMELAYERWQQGGCFSDRGEADRWRMLRDEAIRSRSPAQVAKMTEAAGLA